MRKAVSNSARAGFLWLATAALVLAWLPMVRCILDGPSYQWGQTLYGHQLQAAGTDGDFPFLVVHSLIGVLILFSGWRRPGRLFKVLAVIWSGLLFGDQIWSLLTAPESMTFEGDTLGMSFSVAVLFPIAYSLLFALALTWAWTGEAGPARPWTTANTVLLGAALLLFPLQMFLLSTGQGREASDQIGVLMTIAQWLLISLAFAWGWSRIRSSRA